MLNPHDNTTLLQAFVAVGLVIHNFFLPFYAKTPQITNVLRVRITAFLLQAWTNRLHESKTSSNSISQHTW